MIKQLCSFLLIMFVGSCASKIDFKVPGARFETPETLGEFPRVEVQLGGGVAQKVTIAKSASVLVFGSNASVLLSEEYINSTPSIDKAYQMNTAFRFGTASFSDVYVKDVSDSVTAMGLKFQLIGDSFKERSKGFKLAIAGSYNFMRNKEDNFPLYGNNEKRLYQSDIKIDSYDLNLIMGQRFNSTSLIYLNGFYSELQTLAQLKSSQYGNLRFKGNLVSYGGLVGANFSDSLEAAKKNNVSFSAKIEVGWMQSVWEKTVEKGELVRALSGSILW